MNWRVVLSVFDDELPLKVVAIDIHCVFPRDLNHASPAEGDVFFLDISLDRTNQDSSTQSKN
jgi:hypothetical protein